MIGKHILHYNIIEKLGEGGMGVVYLAEDTKLERQVAIKFLPRHITANSDERKRFEIEAKAAAALNHPNIATIHAIEEADDELFLVMEYIPGKHLKDHIQGKALPVEEAVDIARQVAKGLWAAHQKGIVHRDIKSANIMSSPDGEVKIMDFGLAKFRGSAQLTQVGTTVGTAAFMSPEQARGADVDQRTDIWSFGIVLYELLTGKLPFKGDYEQAIIYSVLNEAPENISSVNPDVPGEVISIVNKCLEKEPDNRYQDMSEILSDLAHKNDGDKTVTGNKAALSKRSKKPFIIAGAVVLLLTALVIITNSFWGSEQEAALSSSTNKNSIAVMYFENNSADEEMKWFSRGLPHMLITDLERVDGIDVLGYQRMYDILKKMNLENIENIDRSTASEVAGKAGVRNILYGSIFKIGTQVRIDFQLEDLKDKKIVLANHVSGEEVLQLVDRLSSEIVTNFITIAPKASKSGKATDNLEAYRYIFEGDKLLNKYNWIAAAEQFEKAFTLDSTFALAYYKYATAIGWERDNTAELAAFYKKALKYGDQLSKVNYRLTEAIIEREEKGFAETIPLFKKVVEDYPNDKEALYQLSESYFHSGKYNEAITVMESLLELDPDFRLGMAHLFDAYFNARQYEKARAQALQQIKLEPGNFRNYLNVGNLAMLTKNYNQALAYYDSSIAHYDKIDYMENPHTSKYSLLFQIGQKERAKRGWRNYLKTLPMETDHDRFVYDMIRLGLAFMYELSGEHDKALDEYNAVYESSGHLRVLRDIAAWHAQFGTLEKAKSLTEELLEKLNNKPNRYYYHPAGYIALAEKEYTRAIKLLEQSSWGYKYQLPLVMAYKKAGRYEDAIAINESPMTDVTFYRVFYPYFMYEIADVYRLMGNKKKALEICNDLLEAWKNGDKDSAFYRKLIDLKAKIDKGLVT